MKRILFKAAALMTALFTLAAGSAALAAAPQYIEEWKPSQYAEGVLNRETFCTLRTEYPVYKTGTTSLYLLLKSNTKKTLTYGLSYTLEKKTADGWYAQSVRSADPDVIISYPAVGLDMFAKSTRGQRTGFYIPLAAGEYRIIKSVGADTDGPYTPSPFCAYFTVADDGYDAARLSDYAPLASLPGDYTREQALKDGVFYIDEDNKVFNQDRLFTFLTKAAQGVPAKLRVLAYGKEGQSGLTDYTYLAEQPVFLREEVIFENGRMLLNPYAPPTGKTGGATAPPQGSPVYSRYYPYIVTKKENGRTTLVISDWIGKPVEQGESSRIAYDVKPLGTAKILGLLEAINGKKPDDDYRVYRNGLERFASYGLDGKKRMLYYTQTPNSIGVQEIVDSRGIIKDILSMEWRSDTVLLLTFSTKEKDVRCELTFDIASGKITGEAYR